MNFLPGNKAVENKKKILIKRQNQFIFRQQRKIFQIKKKIIKFPAINSLLPN